MTEKSIRDTLEFKSLLGKSIYDMTNTEIILFETGGGTDNMTSDLATELANRVDKLTKALSTAVHQLSQYSDNTLVYDEKGNSINITELYQLTK